MRSFIKTLYFSFSLIFTPLYASEGSEDFELVGDSKSSLPSDKKFQSFSINDSDSDSNSRPGSPKHQLKPTQVVSEDEDLSPPKNDQKEGYALSEYMSIEDFNARVYQNGLRHQGPNIVNVNDELDALYDSLDYNFYYQIRRFYEKVAPALINATPWIMAGVLLIESYREFSHGGYTFTDITNLAGQFAGQVNNFFVYQGGYLFDRN